MNKADKLKREWHKELVKDNKREEAMDEIKLREKEVGNGKRTLVQHTQD